MNEYLDFFKDVLIHWKNHILCSLLKHKPLSGDFDINRVIDLPNTVWVCQRCHGNYNTYD